MPVFFATTAKGLVDPLQLELEKLGFTGLRKTASGVEFETNWEGCYLANLKSRLASRILKPVLDFTAYQPDELYGQIRNHDFTKYIKPTQTLSVDASVADGMMRDQRFVALKVKDAIVDQFREKFDIRPDVDRTNADLRIWVRAFKNNFHVSIDTSGDPLNQRGYRRETGDAPIKENLAAGLLDLAEWDQKVALVDPMCGSGTLLIEAAMKVSNIAPGSLRKRFSFQGFQNFDPDVFAKVMDEVLGEENEDPGVQFFGYDLDRKVLAMAKENAKRAGVDHLIEFKVSPVSVLEAPAPEGLVITNPPYAIRLGDEENVRDIYRDLSHSLKTNFKGWDAWILSGNKDLIVDLKMKSTRKHFVFNGPIECRFLKYEVRKLG